MILGRCLHCRTVYAFDDDEAELEPGTVVLRRPITPMDDMGGTWHCPRELCGYAIQYVTPLWTSLFK